MPTLYGLCLFNALGAFEVGTLTMSRDRRVATRIPRYGKFDEKEE
jgi:hypothetical protein